MTSAKPSTNSRYLSTNTLITRGFHALTEPQAECLCALLHTSDAFEAAKRIGELLPKVRNCAHSVALRVHSYNNSLDAYDLVHHIYLLAELRRYLTEVGLSTCEQIEPEPPVSFQRWLSEVRIMPVEEEEDEDFVPSDFGEIAEPLAPQPAHASGSVADVVVHEPASSGPPNGVSARPFVGERG